MVDVRICVELDIFVGCIESLVLHKNSWWC